MLIRLLIAIVLFAHGVGHLLFVANSWGFWRGGEAGRSWLFSGLLGAGQAVEGIFGLLWLVPLVGFVAVSWGYLTQQGWWPQLALASAGISLAMIVLWWGGINTSSAFSPWWSTSSSSWSRFGYDARRLCATEVWKEGHVRHLDRLADHRTQPRTEAKWKEKSHLLPALRAA